MAYRERGVGRIHINVFGLDDDPFRRLRHRHRRPLPEDLSQQTLVIRTEVLHDDKGHPVPGGKRGQQLRDRLETACGGADSNNGKTHVTTA